MKKNIQLVIFTMICSFMISCQNQNTDEANPAITDLMLYQTQDDFNGDFERGIDQWNQTNTSSLSREKALPIAKTTILGSQYSAEKVAIQKTDVEIQKYEGEVIHKSQAYYYMLDNTTVLDAISYEFVEYEKSNIAKIICKNRLGQVFGEYQIDITTNMLTVVSFKEDLVPSEARNWGCNLSIGAAGLVWGAAFGMVTAGAGIAVGAGFLILQTWICSTPDKKEVQKLTTVYQINKTPYIDTQSKEQLYIYDIKPVVAK